MTREDAVKYLKAPENKGKIIPITFVKADGSVRRMDVLVGGKPELLVKNPLKPGMNFEAKGLVGVFDNQKDEYRSFKKDTLLSIVIDGVNQSFAPVLTND